jgi:hypothetical protein
MQKKLKVIKKCCDGAWKHKIQFYPRKPPVGWKRFNSCERQKFSEIFLIKCCATEMLETHLDSFSFTVTKVIACILIASIFVETVIAAPLQTEEVAKTQKPKINRNPHQRRKGMGKKNLDVRKNRFSDIDDSAWRNACGSIDWKQPTGEEQFQKVSYESVSQTHRVSRKPNANHPIPNRQRMR